MLLHDISQTALAAAVLALGLVILLELRSIARLRRTLDAGLARVFEQLDLVRSDTHQSIEAQAQASVAPSQLSPPAAAPSAERPAAEDVAATAPTVNAYTSAATLASHGVKSEEIATRCGLPAGEARLLASLASARARRAKSDQLEAGHAKVGPTGADADVAAQPARRAAGPGKA
jgi:hypothetical protein